MLSLNSDDNNVPDYTDGRTDNQSAQRGDRWGGVFSGSSGGIRIGLVVVGVVSAIALVFRSEKNERREGRESGYRNRRRRSFQPGGHAKRGDCWSHYHWRSEFRPW